MSELGQTTSRLALLVGKVAFSVKCFPTSALLPNVIFLGAMHHAPFDNHQTKNASTNFHPPDRARFAFHTLQSKQTQVPASCGS
jgi:hypothetical protein